MSENIRLYPWFQLFRNLMFWQAIWFLFFQSELSGAEAVTLYAIFDIGVTLLEVPSGYMSDRIGRRFTLILSCLMSIAGCSFLAFGGGFYVYALAQVCLGAGVAFASGTDSALLYESLEQEGRSSEVAMIELRSWRFSFAGLAFSSFVGGFLTASLSTLSFYATAIASIVAAFIAIRFREPCLPDNRDQVSPLRQQVWEIGKLLCNPILAWFFVLSIGMYVFSHVPYVFGQPFILEALDGIGLADDAAIVSGAVTASMMLLSIAASWLAYPLYRLFGLAFLLLLALSLQIGIIGILASSPHPFLIALLLFRMVPDALVKPFILARVQPFLERKFRATYWSLMSLGGRVILAVTLIVVSTGKSNDGPMPHASLHEILLWYIAAGLILLVGLALTVKFPKRAEHS